MAERRKIEWMQGGKMIQLIPDTKEELSIEAEAAGRNLKKHIEWILDERAKKLKKSREK